MRSSSRAGHSSTTTNEEPSWPVRLFRYTESLGWQKQVGGGGEGNAAGGSIISIQASPRKDCIVIPALRQKFTLCGNESNNDKATVLRRNECILLISRTRTKVMVLQFLSLQDCLDFSDRFLALNPFDDDEKDDEDHEENGTPEEDYRRLEAEQDIALAADRESVAAHLVRLVHEPSFEAFVRNVESSLQNTTDGEKILQSWVDRDFGGLRT